MVSRKTRLLRQNSAGWEYDIVAPYYKCNMTDIMAAIGLVQFRRYEGLLKRRKELINRYNKGIECDSVSVLSHSKDDRQSSGHLYLVRLLGKDTEYRNYFIEEMGRKGIPLNVHYKPLPLLSAYRNLGFDIKDYPNAYEMYSNEVTLPLHTKLSVSRLII